MVADEGFGFTIWGFERSGEAGDGGSGKRDGVAVVAGQGGAALYGVGVEIDSITGFVDYYFDGLVVFVEGEGVEGQAVWLDFFAGGGGKGCRQFWVIEGGGFCTFVCVDDQEVVAAAVPVTRGVVDGSGGAGIGGGAGFLCEAESTIVVGPGALGLGCQANNK